MTKKFIKGLLLTLAVAAATYTGANVADLEASAQTGAIIAAVAGAIVTVLRDTNQGEE